MSKYFDPNRKWNEENGYIKVECIYGFVGCKKHKGERGGCPTNHKCVDTIPWTEFLIKSETLKKFNYDE